MHLLVAAQPVGRGNREKEKLLKTLQVVKSDTGKISLLYQLGMLALDSTREELPGIYDQMLLLSRKSGYPRGMGLAYYFLAFHKYLADSLDVADDLIEKSISLTGPYNDVKNYLYCIILKANIRLALQQYQEIIFLTDRIPPAYLKQSDSKIMRGYYSIRGLAYGHMANYAKSLESHLMAVGEAEKIGDRRLISRSYQFVSTVFLAHNEDSMAILYLQKAIAINKTRSDFYHYYALNTLTLGSIYEKQGKYQPAQEYYLEAFEIVKKLPGPPKWGLSSCYSKFAGIFEKRGDSCMLTGNKKVAHSLYDSAINSYRKAAYYFEPVEPRYSTADISIMLGRAYMKKDLWKQARENIEKALELATKTNEKELQSNAFLYLSQIDSAEGDIAGAYRNFKRHKEIFDEIFNMEETKLFYQYKNQADFEKREQELQLLSTENKLKTTVANQQKQKRKFAYTLSGLVLLGTGYGVFRYRKFNKQRSEQRRLKERLAISQDLHDHVGSTLSSISVYSKVAQVEAKSGNAEKMYDLLDKVRDTSSRMITEMNDIVWAINPQNDTMEKIIQRMESFARPLLAARNMQFQFKYDEAALFLGLDMEKRKNFYLIFKETVNNAIKYSGASRLTVTIRLASEMLHLDVEDNGVGFNLDKELAGNKPTLSGNGLINMQKRARELGGCLLIESVTGKGSNIRLQFPV